jgi:phenylpropionate dioxygenase-like ring-hydroxylating dioxygenase large terminal subunit
MLLRNAWYIGAWADELGDKPSARRICGDPVVLFRDGSGRAAALADRCCHRAAPLHLGSLVEAGIQCGYHGLVFDATGRCVTIPGQKLIPQDAQVRSYPTVERDHLVWLWMGEATLADPAKIVDFPYHNDPALRRLSSCRAAHAGPSVAARARPSGQGARPEGARPVPGMRSKRTSRRIG